MSRSILLDSDFASPTREGAARFTTAPRHGASSRYGAFARTTKTKAIVGAISQPTPNQSGQKSGCNVVR